MREQGITMESPVSANRLQWSGLVKDVDFMLQNHLTYSSDIPGWKGVSSEY